MSIKSIFAFKEDKKAILYLLPTPIGNIADMSLRCKEILETADIILCEDTRVTKALIKQLNLNVRGNLISCYSQIESEKGEQIIKQAVKEDLILAYCSDAGSPGISDPGALLVKIALDNDLNVCAIPGPTAFVPALITSGFDTARFIFIGFLPSKSSGRINELKKYSHSTEVLIIYEAPHRMKETLVDLKKVFGDDRKISIAREISKIYENHIYGNIKDICEEVQEFKGECIIIVDKCHNALELTDEEIIKLVNDLVDEGNSLSYACKEIADEYSLRKNYVYKLCINKDLSKKI